MSKTNRIKEHLHALTDIGNIATAMKNLCLIETNKITRFLPMQEKMMDTIQSIGHDFFSFYPNFPMHEKTEEPHIYVVIGSERGFCGNFNDNVIRVLNDINDAKTHPSEPHQKIIIVGHKLAMRMADDDRVITVLDGPNSLEEISNIISTLSQSLEILLHDEALTLRSLRWAIIYNEEDHGIIQSTLLRPFKEFNEPAAKTTNTTSFPPILNIPAEQFLIEFSDQYLFSLFYSVFYKSFYAENYQRLYHLNSSLERIKNQQGQLTQQLNLLRQEEITNEIQIIMLSAGAIIDSDNMESHQ